MLEFTGERVIPGQIDCDLWNEHFSRYAFAARLARRRRVLDVACGSGYGTAELAAVANSAVGIDVSLEAVEQARLQYKAPNLNYLVASAEQLPFRSGAFELVVAFEVIEHLEDWTALVREAHRLLAPGGQFVVSTPNKLYYAESRRLIGANPFHVHEFEFAEFEEALRSIFPSVSLFLQNHAAGIVFHPARSESTSPVEVHVQRAHVAPEESHFFVGVCAKAHQTGAPTYFFLPTASNVLREREQHIAKLESEVAQKNAWLETLKTEHAKLVEMYGAQSEELSATHAWGAAIEGQLAESNLRVAALQRELEEHQETAARAVAGYEGKIAELEQDIAAQAAAARARIEALEKELEAKCGELARCVELLNATEATVEERTRWAMNLQSEIDALRATLAAANTSRWLRFGRAIGVGPNLQGS